MSNEDSGCMIKILIGLAIILVLGGGGCFYAVYWGIGKAYEFAAISVDEIVNTSLDESALTDDEKKGIKASVKKLTDKLRNREIEMEQFAKIPTVLENDLASQYIVLLNFSRKHIAQSGLSDAEKSDGMRTVQRVMRGYADNKISSINDIDSTLPIETVTTTTTEGTTYTTTKIKEKLTDDEIKETLTSLKKIADDAGVEDASFEVDIVKEVDKIIEAIIK